MIGFSNSINHRFRVSTCGFQDGQYIKRNDQDNQNRPFIDNPIDFFQNYCKIGQFSLTRASLYTHPELEQLFWNRQAVKYKIAVKILLRVPLM